jgi:hypothetical protein
MRARALKKRERLGGRREDDVALDDPKCRRAGERKRAGKRDGLADEADGRAAVVVRRLGCGDMDEVERWGSGQAIDVRLHDKALDRQCKHGEKHAKCIGAVRGGGRGEGLLTRQNAAMLWCVAAIV